MGFRSTHACWVYRHTELSGSRAICEASTPPSGHLEKGGGEQEGALMGLGAGLAGESGALGGTAAPRQDGGQARHQGGFPESGEMVPRRERI